jgi:hypothetical protein
MLHEYHVIYSVQYYPRLHIIAVGLGTYYPWIRGHCRMYVCIYMYVKIKQSIYWLR